MSGPEVVKCPNCGAGLGARDYDAQRGVVACSHCNALMTLPSPAVRRADAPMPKGIRLATEGNATLIERIWRRPVAYVLLVAALIWNAFVVFWIALAGNSDVPGWFFLFPLLHGSAGILLLYSAIAMLVNKTQIYLDRNVVRVTHGPIPWAGNLEIAATEIDQLYCKEKVHHGKHGRVHHTYAIHLAAKSGPPRKLLGTHLTREEALFLEQAMEKALEIKDREIPESVR
jgi:hypothetical protein